MKYFLFYFLFYPFFSQALEITATINKKQVAVNEAFVFTISIQSKKSIPNTLDIPDLSHLNDFHLLGQWSGQESSYSIFNGHRETKHIFRKNYRFQPKTSGKLRIESLTIRVEQKVFKTNPIFIIVTKENKNKSPKSSQQNFPFNLPDPFNSPNSVFDSFGKNFPTYNDRKNSIKLQVDLSKKSIYQGEQLKVNWLMLLSSGTLRYEIHKPPMLKGFWKEYLQKKSFGQFLGTKLINDVLYRKNLFDSLWLFPLQIGELKIDSYAIKITDLFGFRSTNHIKSFKSKTIEVKALPQQGRSNSFTGAVGTFEIKTLMKEKEGSVNQPLSYILRFEGTGHPRFIKLPDLKFPASVQIYPPVEKSEFLDTGKSFKEFEFLILPKKEGTLNVPSFTLSTFDPDKEKYIFHKTASFIIPINKGTKISQTGQNFMEETVKTSKNTSYFEPLTKSYFPIFINSKNLQRFWFWFYSFFFLLLASLCLKPFLFKKTINFNQKISQKLEFIEQLLNKKDWQKASTQMISLNYFALYKSQMISSASDWKEILNTLPPSSHKKYASKFTNLFQHLETLSFAPASISEQEALNRTRVLFKITKDLLKSFLNEL